MSSERADPRTLQGASTRSLVLMLPALQARALLEGRDYVSPDDLAAIAPHVFGHRLVVAPGAANVDSILRDDILRGLGVSPNTLKTRVRQLLRVLQHDTLDSLGKTVLRSALDLAPVPQTPHGVPLHVARPPLAGLLPAQRLPREVVEEVPVAPPVRKRPVAPASPSRALTWS